MWWCSGVVSGRVREVVGDVSMLRGGAEAKLKTDEAKDQSRGENEWNY